ncbi:MAG: hypothetical protein ACLVBP_01910 [Ruminococcus sp.]
MNICVYGASSALLKNIYYEKTEELGRAMGKRGHGLVFGGGATGMMGSSSQRRGSRKWLHTWNCSPIF